MFELLAITIAVEPYLLLTFDAKAVFEYNGLSLRIGSDSATLTHSHGHQIVVDIPHITDIASLDGAMKVLFESVCMGAPLDDDVIVWSEDCAVTCPGAV